jgi:hypothetical protein
MTDETAAVIDAPVTAASKLRAFEDEHLGKDATRINGELERGVGSRWAGLGSHKKAHHAALEKLVKAEQGVADASAALDAAESGHAAAVKASEIAEQAAADAEAADEAA